MLPAPSTTSASSPSPGTSTTSAKTGSSGSATSARTTPDVGWTGPPAKIGASGPISGSRSGAASATVMPLGRLRITPIAPSSPWSATSTTVRRKFGSSSCGAAIRSEPRSDSDTALKRRRERRVVLVLAEELDHRLSVFGEARQLVAAALQQVGRTARVVADRVVEVLDRLGGDPLEEPLHRVRPQRQGDGSRGDRVRRLLVRVELAEQLEDLAGADRLRINQVEGLADRLVVFEPSHQAAHHEVDWHDVERRRRLAVLRDRPAALHRHGDRAQHVVRPIELLSEPGLRVAHDDRRAVDRRRDLVHRLAHPDLGLELGRLVVVLEPLAHDQLVLVDHALAGARHVCGRHIVVALEPLAVLAEVDDVACAVDVDLLRELLRHRQVVDRREVEDRLRLCGEARVVLIRQAEATIGDVTGKDLDAIAVRKLGSSLTSGVLHLRLDQAGDRDRVTVSEQFADESFADESRETCDEEHRRGSLGRVLLFGQAGRFEGGGLVSEELPADDPPAPEGPYLSPDSFHRDAAVLPTTPFTHDAHDAGAGVD